MEEKKKIQEHHRILSPSLLLTNDKKDIESLLTIVVKKYKISYSEAAAALSRTLEKLSYESTR